MEWISLHTSVLDSPEFLGAEPLDRATWLCLLRYCIGQENSGIIDNCGDWSDRKWQQLCRVTLAEVKRHSQLWKWLDGSVIVAKYDVKKQNEAQTTRIQARAANQARWKKARGMKEENAPTDAEMQPAMHPALQPAMRHGMQDAMHKRREEKIREEKESAQNKPTFNKEWDQQPGKDSSGHISFPSTTKTWRERLRFRIDRHGSKLEMGGKRIDHEWVEVCRPYHVGWIETIFDEVGSIPLPSDLRRCLKNRDKSYQAWLDAKLQATA